MILFLHNRYRTTGGEERAVEDLLWVVREHLGEEAELLERESATLGRSRAAVAMLRGGLGPEDAAAAVRRTGARVVHAHNVNPLWGWRALAAARDVGARIVLHLHNYRMVCAVGTCFTRGEECTRCHGRYTAPGVRLACRGSRAEATVYGAGLAAWQPRLLGSADAFAVPSAFALARLRELGVDLGERGHVVGGVVREWADRSSAAEGEVALYAGRLAPEKGVDLAIDACAEAGVPLVVAGDGPTEADLRARAQGRDVTFAGRLEASELAAVRTRAALAVLPSLSAETFGLAAAEAMAAGVPVVAAPRGALPEIVEPEGLADPRDTAAFAARIGARYGDAAAGDAGIARARELCSPALIAERLRALYA